MKFNYYNKAKAYLEKEPLARKVENRAIVCWNLLKLHQNPNLEVMNKQDFIRYFSQLQSFDRAVRMVQQEHPELSDKANEIRKQELEVETLKELGYL